MIKLLVALLPNGTVLIQVSRDDKAIAHVELDTKSAESVASQILSVCALARPGDPPEPKKH
jgi:hypothetical protein